MPKILATILDPRMLVSFLMGFSCGLPLLLTITLLQTWMKEKGVDLGAIGLMTLLGLPYTLKFLWAPLVDRFSFPFLGQRRGWLLTVQILLALAIVTLGFQDPAESLTFMVVCAVLVTFTSATQDLLVDAYRREDMDTDEQLGVASSLYVTGYRIAMLLAGGGGLILADHVSWQMVYMVMALCMVPGILTTLFCREPKPQNQSPKTFKDAVIGPFKEFFQRTGIGFGFMVMAFILCFKLGDSMASAMTMPFYLDLGFTKTQIGTVSKLFGFWATIGGLALGGTLIIKLGLFRSLWVFGILQAVSTAGFAVLGQIGAKWEILAAVVAFENITAGMGTSAFLAYIASMTDRRFTATQFALLTALTSLARVVISAVTGFMAQAMGWIPFFWACAFIAIPGLILLHLLSKKPDAKAA